MRRPLEMPSLSLSFLRKISVSGKRKKMVPMELKTFE
jgi:hypothetical protein